MRRQRLFITRIAAHKQLKLAGGYLAAILLPWLASSVIVTSPILREIPFALLFASIAFIGAVFGIGPSLAATVWSAALFNYRILPPLNAWSFSSSDVVRTCILLIAGLAASLRNEQRRRASHKLHDTLASLHERTAALIQAQQSSNSAAWTFSTVTRQTGWYEGGAEIFGLPLDQLSALGSPTGLVLAEDLPKVRAAAALTETTGQPFRVQYRVRWPSGEVHWLETVGTPKPDDPTEWRGVTTDITLRRQAEHALLHSERLAAAGRLASTIAHEINNPLAAVTNLLYLAQANPDLPGSTRHYLEQADRELARLASVTRLTLQFVRSHPAPGPTGLSEMATDVLTLFHSRLEARGIATNCILKPGLSIDVPPEELRQILTNLISNAADACQSGHGVIEINLCSQPGLALLKVSDNGIGIPPENLSRIFDPFFTTKENIGAGIGLWVTRQLVERHGGLITAESGDLAGGFSTSFLVQFPTT